MPFLPIRSILLFFTFNVFKLMLMLPHFLIIFWISCCLHFTQRLLQLTNAVTVHNKNVHHSGRKLLHTITRNNKVMLIWTSDTSFFGGSQHKKKKEKKNAIKLSYYSNWFKRKSICIYVEYFWNVKTHKFSVPRKRQKPLDVCICH